MNKSLTIATICAACAAPRLASGQQIRVEQNGQQLTVTNAAVAPLLVYLVPPGLERGTLMYVDRGA
ncbi:MAG TPA: hypothetical protein VM100_03780, partial [Longimicrobiales bacterium]|nr:hypothetical protein [Longimicrobiales bacterium]